MPQENLNTSTTVLSGGKVRPKENTTIYGAEGSKFLKPGKKYIVHRVQAEKLIEKGAATKTAPEPKKSKGDKDA